MRLVCRILPAASLIFLPVCAQTPQDQIAQQRGALQTADQQRSVMVQAQEELRLRDRLDDQRQLDHQREIAERQVRG